MRLASTARAFVSLALSGITVSAGQQATFRSGVDLVRVDALVTDRGRSVSGLTADDFEILDNGVPQKPSLMTDAAGVTVLLVLDTSASVAGAKLRDLVAATRALAAGLRPDDRAGLVTFRQRVMLAVPVERRGRDAGAIERALDTVAAGGLSAVRDAIFTGLVLAASDQGRSLLLLFSDGIDNASWLSGPAVLEAARRSEVVVYAVASGLDASISSAFGSSGTARGYGAFLQSTVDATGGQLLHAESGRLKETFLRVLDEFRSRYILAYTPTGVRADDGWHALTVKLRSRAGLVKARPGYFAGRTAAREK